MDIFLAVEKLLYFFIKKSHLRVEDKILVRNRILTLLGEENNFSLTFEQIKNIKLESENSYPDQLINELLDIAELKNIIQKDRDERDLLSSKIMGFLIPNSSLIIDKFYALHKERAILASSYYYELAKVSNYIKVERLEKDDSWQVESNFGKLTITINLSKPEKHPKEIEREALKPPSLYPKCVLCRENEGHFFSSRHEMRLIPLRLNNENWYFQYSPYQYYNEHSIVLTEKHKAMKIDVNTFKALFDFLKFLPHYFVGSNADLPLVGGSILSHEHFQAGFFSLPIENASTLYRENLKDDLILEILNWPLSTLRLISSNEEALLKIAGKIFNFFSVYNDFEIDLIALSNERHSTINPIARIKNGKIELDLILRNNRRDEKHPFGIFNTREAFHHIKKENIGLIEAQGLAILPGRIKGELENLKKHLLENNLRNLNKDLLKHKNWALNLLKEYKFNEDNIDFILKEELGKIFVKILEDCAVFKNNEIGLKRFKKFLHLALKN